MSQSPYPADVVTIAQLSPDPPSAGESAPAEGAPVGAPPGGQTGGAGGFGENGLPPAPAEDATAVAPEQPAADPVLPADGGPAEGGVPFDAPGGPLAAVLPDQPLPFGLDGVVELINLGGPVVVVQLVLSVCGLAIIIRKLFQILPLTAGRAARVRGAVAAWVRGDRLDALGLVLRLRGPSAAVVATAMRLTLERRPPLIVREETERVAGEALHRLRQSLRALETIAQVSPLIGLFGTIIGMIEAFRVLQDAGPQVDPGQLAGGIWVALLTTAVGLAVAIPCGLALQWFESRVERERHVMENLATAVMTSAEPRPSGEWSGYAEEFPPDIRAAPLARAAHAP